MRIGTDVNLSTCYEEGYLVMEYKKRELFSGRGKDKIFNKDCAVRFLRHLPEYQRTELTRFPTNSLFLDIDLSAEDVWEMYLRDKESIDETCGVEGGYSFPTDEYELLNLASDVDMYRGLNQ